jgi:hypothetical protein
VTISSHIKRFMVVVIFSYPKLASRSSLPVWRLSVRKYLVEINDDQLNLSRLGSLSKTRAESGAMQKLPTPSNQKR